MKKQIELSQLVLIVASATAILLMVPLVAMQFTDEVDWSIVDFVIMGALLFSTGLSFVLVFRYATNVIYRIAMGLAFGTTLFMIWANLAVGLIGSGPNLGNLMYVGVVAVAIIGSLSSRFTPKGMERVMYATALAVALVAIMSLVAKLDTIPGSSVNEILVVNGFFAVLFGISGSLFHFATREQPISKSEG